MAEPPVAVESSGATITDAAGRAYIDAAGGAIVVNVGHGRASIADGGPQVQFDVYFPREATYRVWVQFQRLGKVNTVAFTVPVSRLK